MKRFNELSSKQKRQAIDYLFNQGINSVKFNGTNKSKIINNKIDELKQNIKFCGCLDCDIKLSSIIEKDCAIKEIILEGAKLQAEAAYYPDDEDLIIKIK